MAETSAREPPSPDDTRAEAGFEVFIINLARDADRREALLAQFSRLADLRPRIVDGVYGSSLPDSLCEALAQDRRWAKNKGTIGCFLSHVKAWEEVARLTDRFALVLEDDVNVAGLRHLNGLVLPDDAEIVFVNDRMSPQEAGSPQPLPIWRALQQLEAAHGGPGGDGYLLTPEAARKLLSACARDFYFGHVDGRLLRYATSEDDLARLPEKSWIAGVVRYHRHPTLIPALGLLKGYCLSAPLVRHLGVPSIREMEDGKTEKIAAAPRTAGAEPAGSATDRGRGLPIRYWTAVSNAGDQINPYVFEAATGRAPYFSPRRNEPHVLGVGSILFMATPQSHVWGSGVLDPGGDYSQVRPQNVHAVRGKLTRELLRTKYGLEKDVPLGDPGIFVDEIPEIVEYTRNSRAKRRVGIIPHHRMIDHAYIRDIARHADVNVINPHLDCIDFIKEIISSEIILSQSLHGLIFAQVFRKPYTWFSHTQDEAWLFKFRDWFSTTSAPDAAPAMFGTSLERLLDAARLPGLAIDRAALRAAVPLLSDERRPGVGFRETRRLAPLAIRVTDDAAAPPAMDYDATVVCAPKNEDCLQKALHALARRHDDSFNLWLVFDHELFSGLSVSELRACRALLDELPDVHYLAVLPARLRVPGQERLAVSIGGRNEPVEARHPSYDWQGVVLVRNPFEFSFSARGRALFRDAATDKTARAA